MTSIVCVSHEEFPDDPYTKEIATICLDDKYRVAYVRKPAKNGGLFWSVASVGVTKDGEKKYFESFMVDSNFLEKDIKAFLEKRPWAKSQSVFTNPLPPLVPYSIDTQQEIPF